ncbi:DUF805 domain-containing protein [Chryseobacterium sp. YIM B08800]|uniref:DUF805 domain-containing protein n=1 Tax=Chryseobacterium sp. YIM B08800 TaxID=2984136 RepID=UPI0022402DF5|nr:DUF805 domain-containing protein [Chryseobacterium sp. YIM B08800]
MFQNVFSTEGRIRRTEFALSILIHVAAVFFTVFLFALTKIDFFIVIAVVVWLAGIIFRVIQGAKRCHDIGVSGWFQFIPFFVIAMIFVDSNRGSNRYGDNPKGIGNYYTIDEIGKKNY